MLGIKKYIKYNLFQLKRWNNTDDDDAVLFSNIFKSFRNTCVGNSRSIGESIFGQAELPSERVDEIRTLAPFLEP